jgi:hypothetical protein
MKLIPKNWANFQHYKHRSPPWIKLHRNLLDDMHFQRLPIASKALAPMLWLLASESNDGVIHRSAEEIAFRLRMTEKEVITAIKPLIDNGFFIEDSNMLAECLQDATPERETEREKETKTEKKKETKAPEGVSIQVWNDFVEQRKKSRAVITETVISSISKEAQKANWSLEQALAECVARGWRGFKAEWVQQKTQSDKKELPLGTDAQIAHAYQVECGFDPTKARFNSYNEMRKFIQDFRDKSKKALA